MGVVGFVKLVGGAKGGERERERRKGGVVINTIKSSFTGFIVLWVYSDLKNVFLTILFQSTLLEDFQFSQVEME